VVDVSKGLNTDELTLAAGLANENLEPRKPINAYDARPNFVYQSLQRIPPNKFGPIESVGTMVLRHLAALREEIDDCQLVALVDLSSAIVLGVSARDKRPQEKLDAYCETAAELLVGKTALIFAGALDTQQPADLSQSVISTKDQTTVFLRSATETSEALILVCAPTVDISQVLSTAKTKLATISADQ
jgi:hypothetical protein